MSTPSIKEEISQEHDVRVDDDIFIFAKTMTGKYLSRQHGQLLHTLQLPSFHVLDFLLLLSSSSLSASRDTWVLTVSHYL